MRKCILCKEREVYKGIYSYCYSCQKEFHKNWRHSDAGKEHNQKQKEKRKNRTPEQKFNHHLKKNYGITIQKYSEMLVNQNGVCAICKNLEVRADRTRLSVDHCHATGKVRGLVCDSCNNLLSKAKDNIIILKNAIRYLENI